MDFLKPGIKQDTLTALTNAPLHMSALFLDHLVVKVEEEICHHKKKCSVSPSHKKLQCFHPYAQQGRQQLQSHQKSDPPAWKLLKHQGQSRRGQGKPSNFQQQPAKGQKSYK